MAVTCLGHDHPVQETAAEPVASDIVDLLE